jgi:hypothetical protein
MQIVINRLHGVGRIPLIFGDAGRIGSQQARPTSHVALVPNRVNILSEIDALISTWYN